MNHTNFSTESSNDPTTEPYVEVTYNGSTFFVPESTAYMYDASYDASSYDAASYQHDASSYQHDASSYQHDASSYQHDASSYHDPNVDVTSSSYHHISSSQDDHSNNDAVGAVGSAVMFSADAMPDIEWVVPAPHRRTLAVAGIPANVHDYFRMLDHEVLRQMEPDDERYKELPSRYHSALPLDDPSASNGAYGSFGYPSSTYKVVDSVDSQVYLLRRLDNLRSNPSIIKAAASKWLTVSHPSIVPLHDIVQDKRAIFFSYHYYAGAQTLRQRFIDQRGPLVNESLIWRILLQLLSAVRYIHRQHRMAVRVLSPVHVILTSGAVARINSIAVMDVTEFESRRSIADMQRDDYVRLGYLVLSLCSRALITNKNADAALLIAQQHFSARLNRVITILLSGDSNSGNLVLEMSCDNLMDEYAHATAMSDALHSHLHLEYDNGRVMRLMMKLGFVNERPDVNNKSSSTSSNWSENGDRYILKLFRDYVFHQHQHHDDINTMKPVLDAGHVISCLNKLDTGSSEQIILSSRDNKDLMIVSYHDIKRCLDQAMMELSSSAMTSSASPHPSSSMASYASPSYPSSSSIASSSYASSSHPSSYASSSGSSSSSTTTSPKLSSSQVSSYAPSSKPSSSSKPSYVSSSSSNKSYQPSSSSYQPSLSSSLSSSASSYQPSLSSSSSSSYQPSLSSSASSPSLSSASYASSHQHHREGVSNNMKPEYDAVDAYAGLKPTAQEWKPSSSSSSSSMKPSSSSTKLSSTSSYYQASSSRNPPPSSSSGGYGGGYY